MNQHLLSFSYILGSSPAIQIAALLLASLAMLQVDEWYRKSRIARKEACIRELEALFALQDCREARGREPWPRRYR